MRVSDAARRARFRVRHAVRPGVTVTAPPAGVEVDRDVEIAMSDGTILRVNVHRPVGGGRYPVIASAHPYGKDHLPKKGRGSGYRSPLQLRLLPQSSPFTISALTGWEAPDPGWWVPRGYVVVNADLRGWGRSDGTGELLSEQEAGDYHDLVEWLGVQPWSNGRVGLSGVSYLALSQWGVGATRPPHLAAICPWEGFTDAYRDFMRPGGVREDGFVTIWNLGLARQHRSPVTIRREQVRRPLFDDWWQARCADLERLEVPALICGSFSDHNLHSGGSFRGFERIGSSRKWLYTHRGPKWATYYGPEALEFQARFFDHFLRSEETGIDDEPPVRLEVRETAEEIAAVRHETTWPLERTEWRTLHLDAAAGSLLDHSPPPGSVSFDTRRGCATFRHRFDEDTELTGPMALRLHLRAIGLRDVSVFAGIRKWRGDRVVGFEGSYGFQDALVTCGWLKASQRRVDPNRSSPWEPVHPHDREEPLSPGQVVALDIGLLPSATLFRAGEEVELLVSGRWLFSRNPLFGPFPAAYQPSGRGRAVLHTGPGHPSHLLIPVIPPPPVPPTPSGRGIGSCAPSGRRRPLSPWWGGPIS